VYSGCLGRDLAMVYLGIASYLTNAIVDDDSPCPLITAEDPTKSKPLARLFQSAVTRTIYPKNYLGELSSIEFQ